VRPFDLHIETVDGVHSLGRIVDALAVYELTPTIMIATSEGEGLRVQLRITGDARACERCANRLAERPSIRAVSLRPVAISSLGGRA